MEEQEIQNQAELTPAPAPEQTDNFSAAIAYLENIATSKQFVSPADIIAVLLILKDGDK